MSEIEKSIRRLQKLFPGISRSTIARNLKFAGPCPVVQKQQADRSWKEGPALHVDNQAGAAGMDGVCDSEFHIAVTLCISDERDRDNDGAYTTLQDCLIASVGRLAQMDSLTLRKHADRLKRKRRR